MSDPRERDVTILLKLWELANAPEAQAARMWMFTEFSASSYQEFLAKYPPGSPEWRRFSSTLALMELYGVLINRGLLDEDLFFDLFGGFDTMWQRVQHVLPGMRKELDPRLYENFELLARRHRAWQEKHPPKV